MVILIVVNIFMVIGRRRICVVVLGRFCTITGSGRRRRWRTIMEHDVRRAVERKILLRLLAPKSTRCRVTRRNKKIAHQNTKRLEILMHPFQLSIAGGKIRRDRVPLNDCLPRVPTATVHAGLPHTAPQNMVTAKQATAWGTAPSRPIPNMA